MAGAYEQKECLIITCKSSAAHFHVSRPLKWVQLISVVFECVTGSVGLMFGYRFLNFFHWKVGYRASYYASCKLHRVSTYISVTFYVHAYKEVFVLRDIYEVYQNSLPINTRSFHSLFMLPAWWFNIIFLYGEVIICKAWCALLRGP